MNCSKCGSTNTRYIEMAWLCQDCGQSSDGPAPQPGNAAQMPPGQMPPGQMPPGQMPPGQFYPGPQQNQPGKTLVLLSHILGWGGLALIFAGSAAVGLLTGSGTAAGVTAAIGGVAAVAGAIIGQIGRAQQGRVI